MKEYRIRHKPTGQFLERSWRNLRLGEKGVKWRTIDPGIKILIRGIEADQNEKPKSQKGWKLDDFEAVEYTVKVTQTNAFSVRQQAMLAKWATSSSEKHRIFRSMFTKLRRKGTIEEFSYFVLIGVKLPKSTKTRYRDYDYINDWKNNVLARLSNMKIPKSNYVSEQPVLAVKDHNTMMILKLALGENFVEVVDLQECKPVEL